ncbi:MAG: twin-arginine translocase TatA/TatE family subunit [Terracidiphilus sp.]|jgi:sec-independent protein translocase protein TatB
MGIPPTIETANIGMADSLILMVMALVVFGPRRLPQIGRQIGKLMYEFRKASNDFKFQMEEELRNAEEAERRKKEEERIKALAAATTTPKLSPTEAMAPLLPSSSDSPLSETEISSATADTVYPDAHTDAYPDDGVVPSLAAPTSEPPALETHPCIQPPSTGEQVLASRPNSHTAHARAAEKQTTADVDVTPENPAEEPAAESEHAHG